MLRFSFGSGDHIFTSRTYNLDKSHLMQFPVFPAVCVAVLQ